MTLIFNIEYRTSWGEEVRVLGSIPELGNNQPNKATPLHTVDGIDGDATVRVGVCPGMRHGSVVDGQNLHRLLIVGNCPVNHALQVAEIAYTEAFLGA